MEDGAGDDDTVRLTPPAAARMAAGGGGSGAQPSARPPAAPPQGREQAGARRAITPRPAPPPRPGADPLRFLLAGLILLAAVTGAALWWWPRAPLERADPAQPVATAPQAASEAPAVAAPPAETARPLPPAAGPPLLAEAEILALLPTTTTLLRLRENPRVFVLLFPTLEEQGAALNRKAALIEKAGLPRDRLLDDAALAEAVRASGDTPATWYLGHDYSGADLARFHALAARDGIALNAAELWVRDRLAEMRALVPADSEIALISVANPDHRMDAAMRAAILRHEIGHGHFFTLPELAAHVLRVWRERFSEQDRQAFRTFLSREGYDTGNETLMANEAMAYLLFTPDPRFFAPHHVGMTEAEVARLRALMREGMPLP